MLKEKNKSSEVLRSSTLPIRGGMLTLSSAAFPVQWRHQLS